MTSVFLTADLAAVLAVAAAAVVTDRLGVAAALAVAVFAADAGSAEPAFDAAFGAPVERDVGRFLAAGFRLVAAGLLAFAAGLRAVPAGFRPLAAGLRAVAAVSRPAAGVVVDDALVVAADRRRLVPDPDPVDPVDESSAIAFSFGTPAAIVHHRRARCPGNPC
ncbi:MAG: hypothetical protein QOI09_1833 [Chloroflexota bacterium]|jgi:hypothetical protein|nr:hypothetical protein [Chloroflexota bacterium]